MHICSKSSHFPNHIETMRTDAGILILLKALTPKQQSIVQLFLKDISYRRIMEEHGEVNIKTVPTQFFHNNISVPIEYLSQPRPPNTSWFKIILPPTYQRKNFKLIVKNCNLFPCLHQYKIFVRTLNKI
mmetsp:Transcript_39555/g.92420  ORF Transcript_39555/g.92420 Transcript_39555/m.92420 type:complete len:129 (+) Transcript_39555:485-871(+)